MTTPDNEFDAIIVGGGVVGCSMGFAAANLGARVLLLEQNTLGSGISSNTFAWANATAKPSDKDYFDLNWTGLNHHHQLAERFGAENTGLHASSMVEWTSESNMTRLNEMQARYQLLAEAGYGSHWLNREQLQSYLPNVTLEKDAVGMHSPRDAWVDIPKFISFLATQITSAGGVILEHCGAERFLQDENGEVIGVQTPQGMFYSEITIICSGQHTPDTVAALADHDAFASRFPMQRVPGIMLKTPPLPESAQLHTIVYASHDHSVHMRPTPDGGLLIGDDEVDGWISMQTSEQDIVKARKTLLSRAKHYLREIPDSLEFDQCEFGIGIRAVPNDDHTIVGTLPGSNNAYVVCTHSGVTLCLFLAELMIQSVSQGQLVKRLAPYSFNRFNPEK